ncbi:hypothetical protein RB594_007043 [Gaeumannomyces avenae]
MEAGLALDHINVDMFTFRYTLALLLCVLAVLVQVRAQDVPLQLTGAFEGATATDSSFNTGGSISVLGFNVVVPKNLQVTFPATFIPWKDFVADQGKFAGYEVTVDGNLVNNVPIAGMISVSQFSVQGGQGVIDKINVDGTMSLQGGPKLRINDPKGVYGLPYADDPFFTSDGENPSISAFSGFPMCVPRSSSDPLCPATQRPLLTGNTRQGSFLAPDALVMAPFMAGDFIEYSGFKRGDIIYATEIVATNVQITTDPNRGDPTYIRMEDAIMGVFTADPAAEVGQVKFIGYTSFPSANIAFTAMDINVCTGEVTTTRLVGTTATIAGAARNKFDFRLKAATSPVKYTREYLVTLDNPVKVTRNGLKAGQYVAPIGEWIQPEVSTPGSPAPAHQFRDMDFLSRGLGFDGTNIWGPLSPFPQSGVTVFDPASCPPPVIAPTGTPVPTSTSTTAAPTASSTVVPDAVSFVALSWASSQSGTLTATCRSAPGRAGAPRASSMSLQYSNRDGSFQQSMTAVAGSAGDFTFSSRGVRQPSGNVRCVSDLGGSVTGTL